MIGRSPVIHHTVNEVSIPLKVAESAVMTLPPDVRHGTEHRECEFR